jgi:hypothetical protein
LFQEEVKRAVAEVVRGSRSMKEQRDMYSQKHQHNESRQIEQKKEFSITLNMATAQSSKRHGIDRREVMIMKVIKRAHRHHMCQDHGKENRRIMYTRYR